MLALRLAAAAVTASQDSGRVSGPEPTLAVAHALYYGHGTLPSPQAAATQYRHAIKALGQRHIPAYYFPVLQAKLALGYMHQFGTGVPQDLHLAKRYYDSALGESGAAWLPARFALVVLSAHRMWRDLAAARPVLRRLETPVKDAVTWSLHRLRRFCDPVYAFHAPSIPHVAYVPGALEPNHVVEEGAAVSKGSGSKEKKIRTKASSEQTARGTQEEERFWLDDIDEMIDGVFLSIFSRVSAGTCIVLHVFHACLHVSDLYGMLILVAVETLVQA